MPMGLGIHRPIRVYPLAAHGSVGSCVQWSRVFSHPLGRFQYVQVLRGGAQENDYHLGNFLDTGITLVFCNLETIGCTIMFPPLSWLISG